MATSTSNEFASAMEQGLQAQQAGNTEKAYSFFARATELDPNSGEAWYGRAGTAGDPDDALVSLGYATALQPDNHDLPPQLEFTTQMRASVVGPSDAPTLVMVGQKLAEVGLTSQAEYLFRRAKELDANMEDASVWLAAVTKDPAESERLLKKVLEQNPDNPLARAGLSEVVAPDLAHPDDGNAPAPEATPPTAEIYPPAAEVIPPAAEIKPLAAEATPPSSASPSPAAASPQEQQPEVDEAGLPDWLVEKQKPAEPEETPPAETAPVDDFASELQRALSEAEKEAPPETSQAPAETTQPAVPEDLATQPWWNELQEPAAEAPAAPAEQQQEATSTWWSELEQTTEASGNAEQMPEDLESQSWWKSPETTEEQATAAPTTEPPAEAASETQTVASGEWWQEPTEEAATTAPAQDSAALAADLLRQGQQALDRGDKAAAYTFFVGTLELTPDNEAALWGRAQSTEDAAERIESLERVLELNPNNLAAREALTLSRVRKLRDEGRRVPGARERAEQPSEEQPSDRKPVAEVKPSEPRPSAQKLETSVPSVESRSSTSSPAQGEPVPSISTPPAQLPTGLAASTSEPPARPGMDVTPLIQIALGLIVLILLVLAALYILKL